MVIQIFVNIELESLCYGSDEVHTDVTLVLGLVHHLQAHSRHQLESHQAAHLAVDVGGWVDLEIKYLTLFRLKRPQLPVPPLCCRISLGVSREGKAWAR